MWLLEPNTLEHLRAVVAKGVQPSAEQQQEIVARLGRNEDGSPRILSKAGNTAQIEITGVLTERANIMALLFGGGNTTYADIRQALTEAEQDKSVESIELLFDTPGGSVAGLFDTLAAVQATSKRTIARVGNQAASAGFILASQADELIANNRASAIGSFGVAAEIMVNEDVVSITNTESPDKRPDVTTEEGRATVREHLDAYHALFVEQVARGRDVSEKKATQDFGRGALLLADEAKNRGMIDSVGGDTPVASGVKSTAAAGESAGEKPEPETDNMDLATLKANHPELYNQVVQIGADQERDRVGAFAKAAEIAGNDANAQKLALQCIADGSEMTQTRQMEFMGHAVNKRDVDARAAESEEAEAAAQAGAGGEAAGESDDPADQVAAALEAEVGVQE